MTPSATAAARYLRSVGCPIPKIAIVAGSGLSALSEAVEAGLRIPYAQIPGWPIGHVAGHQGQLVCGSLAGTPVALAAGRAHLYEGFSPQEVAHPVASLAELGAAVLIVTNAAGSLNPAFGPGAIMLIADHLFFPGLAGLSPLVGPDQPESGPRFPAMVGAYDGKLRRLATDAASGEGLVAHEGIYAMVAGPSYETPAEARMLRHLGADAVGMSTVPEVIVARQRGMRVLGISVITNVVETVGTISARSADTELQAPSSDLHLDVTHVAASVAPRLARVISAVVEAVC